MARSGRNGLSRRARLPSEAPIARNASVTPFSPMRLLLWHHRRGAIRDDRRPLPRLARPVQPGVVEGLKLVVQVIEAILDRSSLFDSERRRGSNALSSEVVGMFMLHRRALRLGGTLAGAHGPRSGPG